MFAGAAVGAPVVGVLVVWPRYADYFGALRDLDFSERQLACLPVPATFPAHCAAVFGREVGEALTFDEMLS